MYFNLLIILHDCNIIARISHIYNSNSMFIIQQKFKEKIVNNDIICNVMKSYDQSRDRSNQIGTISDHYSRG